MNAIVKKGSKGKISPLLFFVIRKGWTDERVGRFKGDDVEILP
jgi:hypothetical protein